MHLEMNERNRHQINKQQTQPHINRSSQLFCRDKADVVRVKAKILKKMTRALLFEGKLALTQGYILTRASFSFVQKHFPK